MVGACALEPPIAVVTAGPVRPGGEARKSMQAAPAQRSQRGWYRNVEDADHRTLLGLDHGEAIIEGIAIVRASL